MIGMGRKQNMPNSYEINFKIALQKFVSANLDTVKASKQLSKSA